MSILKAQSMFSSSCPSSILNNKSRRYHATLQVPISPKNKGLSIPKLPLMINAEKLRLKKDTETKLMQKHAENTSKEDILKKLYTVLEAVADRAEMHSIIGHQRNDWNKLFLTSINSITLTASLLAAISSINPNNGLDISSTILFGSATILMLLINKLQPSQLSEEQTKATQLFKQLQNSIHTAIALGTPTEQDVEDFMQKVMAIDQAYPLPLLPLLEKFPKKVEGARWWPQEKSRSINSTGEDKENRRNGWSDEMEQEMRGVLRVMKEKDEVQYRECGELAVKINKVLAVAGPVFAGMAAIGSSQISNGSSWGVLLATVGGAVATVVNTMEHGGQIGMVFELFRNNVGFFNYLEEEIESNLGREVNEREDGELFRMRMALKLGRSIPEMKGFASYASDSTLNEDIGEFACKLF